MVIHEPLKIYSRYGVELQLDRASYIKEQVSGKTVLHIGCADYPVTRERLEKRSLLHLHLLDSSSSVCGVDSSESGITILTEVGIKDLHLMDAEKLKIDRKFDIILAGDVLEHMSNPGMFLECAKSLLNPNGSLIIGAPNAYSFNIIKYVLQKYEPTHRDHCYFFSPKTLTQLCSRYEFLPVRLIFTVQPCDSAASRFLLASRRVLVPLCRRLAPSIIMHFKQKEYVGTSTFFIWS